MLRPHKVNSMLLVPRARVGFGANSKKKKKNRRVDRPDRDRKNGGGCRLPSRDHLTGGGRQYVLAILRAARGKK